MQDEDATPTNVNDEEESLQEQPSESPENEAPETPESQEGQDEQEVEDEQPEDGAQEDEQPEPQMSRRKQLRIQKLLNKMGVSPEDLAPSKKDSGPDFRDMVDADDEVYRQLSKRASEYAESQRREGANEARFYSWRTELKIDSNKVNDRWHQFDQNSPDFKPQLADAINNMYLASVGYDGKSVKNPDISFYDYVEGIMELADEAAETKVQTSRRNAIKQASRTGIRPDGTVPRSMDLTKDPTQMSDAELAAALKKLGLSPQ